MNQMLKRAMLLTVMIFTFAGVARAGGYTGQVNNRKQVCMLQDGVKAQEGLETEYHGKKYYLCCGGCLAGFKTDPARYSHASDPVNGKLVDKADAPIYAYQGRAFFFSSTKTQAEFAAHPQKYLREAVGNAEAPENP